MKKLVAVTCLLLTASLWAQTTDRPKVYLNETDQFSNAFAAGVQKKQVPVALVTDPAQARYLVTFNHETNNGSKARGITTAVFTGVYADGSFERVSMSVVDAQTKEIVFSYTCKKSGGGVQSAAECLAKHWKQHLTGH